MASDESYTVPTLENNEPESDFGVSDDQVRRFISDLTPNERANLISFLLQAKAFVELQESLSPELINRAAEALRLNMWTVAA